MSQELENPGVVIHLDEASEEKHAAVLRNISHLREEMDPSLRIELVVHGPGITTVSLRGNPLSQALVDLMARGVVVAACENTLRQKDIDRVNLLEGVVTVPAGIAELVVRQQQGWAYVRP